jgi:hypothetical protein
VRPVGKCNVLGCNLEEVDCFSVRASLEGACCSEVGLFPREVDAFCVEECTTLLPRAEASTAARGVDLCALVVRDCCCESTAAEEAPVPKEEEPMRLTDLSCAHVGTALEGGTDAQRAKEASESLLESSPFCSRILWVFAGGKELSAGALKRGNLVLGGGLSARPCGVQ